MTYKFFGALLAISFLFTTTVHALESWEGTKYVYSSTDEAEYVLKIELGEDGSGTLTTRNGVADVTFTTEKEKVFLMLQGDIQNVSYPFKVIEETGFHGQVEMTSTLQTIELEGNEYYMTATEYFKDCYEYAVNGATVQKCDESIYKKDEGLVLKDSLPSLPMNLVAGNKITVPMPGYGLVYLQLKANKKVEVLMSGDNFEGMKFHNWFVKDNKLNFLMDNGAEVSYQITMDYEGVQRVMGEYWTATEGQMLVGALMVDQDVDVSGLKMEDMAGKYKTVLAGTTYQFGTLYEFDKDGFGGFDSFGGGDVHRTSWMWSFVNGEMVANRYRLENGPMVDSDADMKACADGTMAGCKLMQTRSYKVIGQTGNRYTMLRKLTHNKDDGSADTSVSVWTFYKQ